jgi:hypothetical protein
MSQSSLSERLRTVSRQRVSHWLTSLKLRGDVTRHEEKLSYKTFMCTAPKACQ